MTASSIQISNRVDRKEAEQPVCAADSAKTPVSVGATFSGDPLVITLADSPKANVSSGPSAAARVAALSVTVVESVPTGPAAGTSSSTHETRARKACGCRTGNRRLAVVNGPAVTGLRKVGTPGTACQP